MAAAHPASHSRVADRGPQSTTIRTSTKQDTLADHVAEFLSRIPRALRNLADSADHAARLVRKADTAKSTSASRGLLWDFRLHKPARA